MRGAFFIVLFFAAVAANGQEVYTIKADSTKLKGCDSANELIIENHTQNVKGFLYNTGKGRTIFLQGAIKLTDSSYLIGSDTIKTRLNPWVQNGNAFGMTGKLGTLDNNHLDLYTNNLFRTRFTSTGKVLIGSNVEGSDGVLQVNGALSLTATLGDAIYFKGITHALLHDANNKVVLPRAGGAQGGFFYTDVGNNSWTFYTNAPDLKSRTIIAQNELRQYTSLGSINPGAGYWTMNWTSGGISAGVNGTTCNILTASFGGNIVGPAPYYHGTNVVFTGGASGDQAGPNSVGFPGTATVKGGDAGNGSTNYPGANVILQGGRGSGTGAPGDVVISTATKLSSGTTLQSATDRVYIKGDSGYVGIGVSSPTTQLHTTGGVRFAGLTNDDSQTRIVVSDANGKLYYRNASSLAAADVLHNSLAVNGPIRAKSLTLSQTGWPDYVFDSAYHLLPLKEVEDYVRMNKHLPGVPAARVVEKDGVSVGDAQSVMLKKIEELTLYNIAQQKELQTQQKELEAQHKQLEAQREELQMLRQKMNMFRPVALMAKRHMYIEIVQALGQINQY